MHRNYFRKTWPDPNSHSSDLAAALHHCTRQPSDSVLFLFRSGLATVAAIALLAYVRRSKRADESDADQENSGDGADAGQDMPGSSSDRPVSELSNRSEIVHRWSTCYNNMHARSPQASESNDTGEISPLSQTNVIPTWRTWTDYGYNASPDDVQIQMDSHGGNEAEADDEVEAEYQDSKEIAPDDNAGTSAAGASSQAV